MIGLIGLVFVAAGLWRQQILIEEIRKFNQKNNTINPLPPSAAHL